MNTLDFCQIYLENYTINPDDTVDINGDVNLYNTVDVDGDVDLYNALDDMKKLPIKFGKVSGWFTCSENKLTTLKGCPTYVDGNFYCKGNKLVTLEGCPNYIGENFYCNKLTHHILGNVYGNIYFANRRVVI
jgi:hypothetical protein